MKKNEDALAVALAAGRSLRDGAAETGISERSAQRRWSDPAFRAKVAALRSEMIECAIGAVVGGMSEAVATLKSLLSAESEATRLGACRTLLQLGVELRDSAEDGPPPEINLTLNSVNIVGLTAEAIEARIEAGASDGIDPTQLTHLPRADRIRLLRKLSAS